MLTFGSKSANSKFSDLFTLPPDTAVADVSLDKLAKAFVAGRTLRDDTANDIVALCRRALELKQPGSIEIVTEHAGDVRRFGRSDVGRRLSDAHVKTRRSARRSRRRSSTWRITTASPVSPIASRSTKR